METLTVPDLLARRVAGWATKLGRARRQGASFRLEGYTFTNVRALPGVSSPRSKAGNLRWRGKVDGIDAKIIELNDTSHARFLEELSGDERLKHLFPRCIGRFDNTVVFEWVPGRTLRTRSPATMRTLVRAASELHLTLPPEAPSFDYASYLQTRMTRFRGMLPIDDAMSRIHDVLDTTKQGDPGMSHADITPRNIVRRPDGRSVIVDNELLGANRYHQLDLFNIWWSLGGVRLERRRTVELLRTYRSHGGDLSPLLTDAPYFEALWTLRRIGSRLEAGHLGSALDLAHAYARKSEVDHPLLLEAMRLVGD